MMNIKKTAVVILAAIGAVQAFAQGWELTEDEKNVLREGAICYSIDRPGRFERDPRVYDEFDRLEILMLKDENGRPDNPCRLKMFSKNGVREWGVLSPKPRKWNTTAEKLLVDMNPLPDIKDGMKVRDEKMAVSDGILAVVEKDGIPEYSLVFFARKFSEYEEFPVAPIEEEIYGVGKRLFQQWSVMDDGLHWCRGRTKLMKYRSKITEFFARRKYVCAYASYASLQTKTGWIKTATDKELPFVVKARIWDVKDEMTRANALCIARVSGCIRLNGASEIKVECEKGDGELDVAVLDSPLHETAKNVCLRYKGAETSVLLQVDMSADELVEFGDNLRKRERVKFKGVQSQDL